MNSPLLGKGPEKVFIVVRNDDGSDIAAGTPLEWKADGTRDGIDVQALQTAAKLNLLVGDAHQLFSDGEYGMAQVYGYDDDAVCYAHGTATNSNIAIGDVAIPSSGGAWTFACAGTVLSNNPGWAAAMATVGSASASSITTNAGIFLRCM